MGGRAATADNTFVATPVVRRGRSPQRQPWPPHSTGRTPPSQPPGSWPFPSTHCQEPAPCVCARVRVCPRACVRACVFYKSPVNTPLSEMSSVPGEISHYVDPKPAFQTVCVLGSQQFPQSCSHSTFHSQTRRALDPASAPH